MKGSLDIATLVVVMIPMSIFLIFGGQQLSKAQLNTDLQASLEYGKERFKGYNKLYQVMTYRPDNSSEPLYRKIVKYQASSNKEDLEETIENRINLVLRDDYKHYYQVNIWYPGKRVVHVRLPGGGGKDLPQLKNATFQRPTLHPGVSSRFPNTHRVAVMNLPSPEKGFITVEMRALS
ncbi:MAG: hypothetical protein ABEJ93_01775 [Candidatus Nanohalobium sp.]